MSTNKIRISDLDFDLIKTNLKTFLQGQSEFTDYNFEGAGLNVLLDVLAYNTHYNAMYTNLAFNEMFLDSASKRDSIVSIANNFGYLPTSKLGARAVVNMVIPALTSTDNMVILPKYSAFSSTINSVKYTFYTITDYSGLKSGTNFSIPNVELVEGTPVTEKFTVFNNNDIVLNNLNIDVTTLKVTVQDVADSLTTTTYGYVDNMVTLGPTDKVYFVKEIEGGKYKVFFGKNNLGYEPGIGSIITIEYMMTSGSLGNGVKLFSYDGLSLSPGSGTPINTLVTAAVGGKEIETNDEVKYNVSHKFRTQDRAVTADDYVSIIKSNYDNGDAVVTCWGGETMDPPIYGKVYASIKPAGGYFLTATERDHILNTVLKPKSVVGMYPVLVDPEYILVELTTKFYYNPNMTNRSASELVAGVRMAISDYNINNLQKFGGTLRQSRLSRVIDDSDPSITNSITHLHLRKNINVVYNTTAQYVVAFNNPIPQAGFDEGYVTSSGFYINPNLDIIHYVDDDGLGGLRLFYYNAGTQEKIVVNSNFGSVNYVTGLLTVNAAFISGIVGSNLQCIVEHRGENVVSKYNQIVNIETSLVTVTAIQENTQM